MLRRTFSRLIPVLALALAMTGLVATAAPGHAQAATAVGTNHSGWVYLNPNYCAPNRACAKIYRSSIPAWSWSGASWSRMALPGGWVYVYPYSGQWRWAWTQRTGWLAVSGGRFEVR